MRLEAFAKINWSLDIIGIREDGYHLMDMIMQPVSLADEIVLTPADNMEITTDGYPRSRADKTNLAMRAALLNTAEPVTATIATVLWLKTSFSVAELVGFALVLAMVFLTTGKEQD